MAWRHGHLGPGGALLHPEHPVQWHIRDADLTRRVSVSLAREVMAVAADALKTNITILGPLVLPLSEQLKFLKSLELRRVSAPVVSVRTSCTSGACLSTSMCMPAGAPCWRCSVAWGSGTQTWSPPLCTGWRARVKAGQSQYPWCASVCPSMQPRSLTREGLGLFYWLVTRAALESDAAAKPSRDII